MDIKLSNKKVLLKSVFVIPRNNERWYGSAVRSTAREILKENAAKQFHRESLDLFYAPNLHSEYIKIKDEKIKQRERLRQAIEEQSDQNLQDELFSKLEAFEIDKSKEN